MFRMSFILKYRKDGSLSLVLPIGFRFIFIIIAILLTAGIFASKPEISRQWIPILITAACIAGALYEEKWIFSTLDGRIEYISGIMFISKKKSFNITDAEIFKLSGNIAQDNSASDVKRGIFNRLQKKMVKFSLILKSGQVLDIDITTGRTDSIKLKEKAGRIAAFCQIELLADSNQ